MSAYGAGSLLHDKNSLPLDCVKRYRRDHQSANEATCGEVLDRISGSSERKKSFVFIIFCIFYGAA